MSGRGQSKCICNIIKGQGQGLTKTMIGTAIMTVRKMYRQRANKMALQVLASSLNFEERGIVTWRC